MNTIETGERVKNGLDSSPPQTGRRLSRDFFLLYLPIALCFLVINITNDRILNALARHGHIYGNDPSLSANFGKTTQYFLVPLKSLIFFVSTAILIYHLAPAFKRIYGLFKQQTWVRLLLPMLICSALTFNYAPVVFGRSYARISTDPFNQGVDQVYRRLLTPGLANLYHMDGFFFIFFFWFLVFVTVLAFRLYCIESGSELTLLQEVSFLTVGTFVSAWQCPAYPEIGVLLLALIALMEFQRDSRFTLKQVAAFSLALMTHEACAVIVFVPMILFLFGRKAWLSNAAVGLMYATALLANFSFNISAPLSVQTTVSDLPAQQYLLRWPMHAVIGAAFSFKLLWLIVPVGLYLLFKRDRRLAYFALSGFLLAAASIYVGIDYTRLIAFATIPMIFCFLEFRKNVSVRIFNAVALANLLIPSFFVAGNSGVVKFPGLYLIVYSCISRLHAA
jgi:hypothetical protein